MPYYERSCSSFTKKCQRRALVVCLVLYLANVVYPCPDSCHCYYPPEKSYAVVKCGPQNVNSVSKYDTADMRILEIRCKSYDEEYLKNRIVYEYTSVTKLTIRCVISNISDTVMDGMDQLQKLSMSSWKNSIIYPSDFISKLSLLEDVELIYNSGGTMPSLCQNEKLKKVNLYKNFQTLENLGLNCSNSKSVRWSNLTELYLSYNVISKFPLDILSRADNLDVLDLSHNLLINLDGINISNCSKLTYLNVGFNVIKSLARNTFYNCIGLRKLMLTGNSVLHFESGVFSHIGTLQMLSLSNANINDSYVQSIDNLENLSILILKTNRITMNFDICLNNTKCVSTLDLSHCKISRLRGKRFHCFKQLRVLKLPNNNISSIDDIVFVGLSHLRFLDLSWNCISSISKKAFRSLTSLKQLILSRNGLKQLPMFMSFQKMTYLDLSHNALKTLNQHHFRKMISLETLFLNNNLIHSISGLSFAKSSHLVLLDLSNNNLSSSSNLEFDGIFNNPSMQGSNTKLNLNNNSLSEIPPDIKNMSSLGFFYIRDNNIIEVVMSSFPTGIVTIDLSQNFISSIYGSGADFPYAESVDLRSNDLHRFSRYSSDRIKMFVDGNVLTCDCNMAWLLKTTASQYILDLNKVKCHVFDGSVHLLENLSEQDFLCAYSNNICPSVCKCFRDNSNSRNIVNCNQLGLSQMPRTFPKSSKTLLLDDNNITEISHGPFSLSVLVTHLSMQRCQIKIIHSASFSKLRKLQSLYLNDNQIQKLTNEMFDGLVSLKELLINNNKIKHIEKGTFTVLSVLNKLDLRNNSLMTLGVTELSFITNVSYFYISRNPWSCKCKFLNIFRNVLDRVMKRKEIDGHTDIKHIVCMTSTQVNNILDTSLYNQCTTKLSYLFNYVIPVSIILSLVVITIMFRKRDLFKVWVFSKFGRRLYKSRLCETDVIYDAFISNSDLDEKFVVENIILELEKKLPEFKLCLRNRDWNPGIPIMDNAVHSIETSRTCVMLISDNFLESRWCEFESMVAHYQYFIERKTKLIVVLLHPINKRNVYSSLKLYMDTGSFLKVDDRWFWDKLRLELSK